jgi:GAF domain-containing protein
MLSVLAEFARAMTETYDVTDALSRLGEALTDVLDVTGVGISVVDPDGALRYATSTSELVTAIERVQENAQAGPCYEAFQTNRPVLVPEIDERADWNEFRTAAGSLGLRSVAGVPIAVRREVLGAVNLYQLGSRTWTPQDIETAGLFADMAAAYLLHAALEDTRRLADQLQYALDSRIVIEQAKGILAAAWGVSVDEAFHRLRSYVRGSGTTLRAAAGDVVQRGFRPPDPA